MKTKHEQHPCIVRPVPKPSPHKYEVYCTKCQKHVQWAKRDLYEAFSALNAEK
jgi:hypothetical protein